jgi:redox-sensitive bicupin YhaK (pirin superfamily)
MTRLVSTSDEDIVRCAAAADDVDCLEILDAHATSLGGGFTIRRALPLRERRMIGPWCFLDHIGPVELDPQGEGLHVRPHPHIGLQTVTWLADGAVLHRDSLGYREVIRPGALHVMTSGAGISHSEESPAERPARLHGAQLWCALPEARRHGPAAFERAERVPSIELGGARGDLFSGELGGERVEVSTYWPQLGIDLRMSAGARAALPLERAFEHGLLVLEGAVRAEDRPVAPGQLLYVRPGRETLRVECEGGARFVLIGGAPFEAPILMWWNFVARTRDEILEAREQWEQGHPRFGRVDGWGDVRIPAPTALPAASTP